MKISDLAKRAKKAGGLPKLGGNFDLKKFKVSLAGVLWVISGLIFAAELSSLYVFGYKNLVFTQLKSEATSAAVRVNFVNYDKVVKRLAEARNYHATSTINFLGNNARTGRASPFDDPE